MNKSTPPEPVLPEGLAKSIEGKDSGGASTLLSMHRTALPIKRTGLSGLRPHGSEMENPR